MPSPRPLDTLLLTVLFGLFCGPLLFTSDLGIYDQVDEQQFHLPTIEAFASELPEVDLDQLHSATTPLYHMVMALLKRIFELDLHGLRVVNALISLICLIIAHAELGGRIRPFILLFMFTPYFIGPAVRLSTDNAALLFMLLSLRSMERSAHTIRAAWLCAVFITITLLVRQNYAWLIGVQFLFAFSQRRDRVRRLLPLLLPVSALFFFVWQWGGLNPPDFAGHRARTLNGDVFVYVFALLGSYSLFILSWLRRDLLLRFRAAVPLAASVLFLLIHPVNGVYHKYRGGGLWRIAAFVPEWFSSSILFWILFPIGVWVGCAYAIRLNRRGDRIMMLSFALWLAANMVTTRTWQKYYDPFLLFSMGRALDSSDGTRKADWIGPMVLVLLFILISLFRFYLSEKT